MNCNQSIETQYIGELPIDNLDSMPDYLLGERDVLDAATGNVIRSLVRVPTAKIFPQANMDNVVAIEPNNVAIFIPENQVRAVYVKNAGSSYIMEYADATHKPTLLAINKVADQILCQNSGIVNIPEGHQYIVGEQYYVGDDGEPTTTQTPYKLFIPISATKLAINIYG